MNTADPTEMAAWDNYFGQLVDARFDRDRPDVAAKAWAAVADAMFVERKKRNLSPLQLAAWDVFYGSIIAGYGGVASQDGKLVATACASAADAADDLLAEHVARWKGPAGA